jgi:hypothetical protein
LFRFALPCLYRAELWTAGGIHLGEEHQLLDLAKLENLPTFAEVRAAWNEQGLAFSVRVTGKRKPLWCREGRIAESDGLHVWIDTRPSQKVHRATRFCQHFAFLPQGGERNSAAPVAGQLLINRAKEQAEPASTRLLHVRSEQRVDGYLLEAFLEARALPGYNPAEQPQLGFTYAVHDSELGRQELAVGKEFPYDEDPSLWALLDLVRE